MPLAGLTAYRALFKRAMLLAGERVLITGIGGGVSQMALLFALAAGCRVAVTSSSAEKRQAALAQGAEFASIITMRTGARICSGTSAVSRWP